MGDWPQVLHCQQMGNQPNVGESTMSAHSDGTFKVIMTGSSSGVFFFLWNVTTVINGNVPISSQFMVEIIRLKTFTSGACLSVKLTVRLGVSVQVTYLKGPWTELILCDCYSKSWSRNLFFDYPTHKDASWKPCATQKHVHHNSQRPMNLFSITQSDVSCMKPMWT